MVSVYQAMDAGQPPATFARIAGAQKIAPPFLLEDDEALLPNRDVYVTDLTFASMPPDPDALFTGLLLSATRAEAVVSWLGFEAAFSFRELLTPAVRNAVYGVVCTGAEPALALTERECAGAGWARTVACARELIVA
jgi:hypothetical protein